MRRNPLVLFLGAAIVAILAVLGFTYPKWAPTSLTQEVSAPAAETAAATPETPAEPAAAETAPAAEAAATEPVKPTFDVVRVEPDGSAVIAGRASPAADVVVTLSGNELGAAKATENGEWVVVTTTPIAPGSYELKAVAKVGDTQVVSDQSVALVVPAAGTDEKVLAVVSEPNKPSQVLSQEAPAAETTTAAAEPAAAETAAAEPAAAEPAAAAPAAAEVVLTGTVSIDTVDYNETGDVIFSGKGPVDTDVRLYANNNSLGFAAVSPEGSWNFTSRGLIEPGDYTLRADAVDDTGKVIARIELPFTRATPEAVAEAEAVPKDGKITIQPGNNLWRISRVIYGDGDRYTVIYEANKDQIRDPNIIYPGQILMTPGVVPPETIDPDSREPLPSVQ
jgi:nucleoid-associated protein YgaU